MTITPYVPDLTVSALPRGNQLLQSQTFDNAAWTKTNVSVTANQTTDVFGLTTVDLITRTSASAAQISQGAAKSAAAVQTITLSFDAKKGTAQYLAVRAYGSSTANRVDAIFDLTNGILVSYAATGAFALAGAGALISPSGINGLFNCLLTFTTDAAATYTVAFSPSSVSQQVDGTGSSSGVTVYLSQAQGEPYANQSAYALTTGAQDPGIWAGVQGLPVLPHLPGQAIAVSKAPKWSTQVIQSASGRRRATSYWPYPLWQFELQYGALRKPAAVPNLAADELVDLWEFFNAQAGQFGAWLFVDVTDCQVPFTSPAAFGTGDGATTSFQLGRYLNSVFEPCYGVYQPIILDNGSPTTSALTFSANGVVTFGTAPAAGHALTWFGYFYFGCAFAQDDLTAEQFTSLLWTGKSLKFASLRA